MKSRIRKYKNNFLIKARTVHEISNDIKTKEFELWQTILKDKDPKDLWNKM